ncbi:hypothetical protein DY000_02043900 [Brassica cretica]|uniref:Uncharacterized protein n=1 Tax=Brassica cretica TaxID=69181 RepID=A0ABQ7B6I5_BRACR|nr:hypothetical protein DY000_02043900 [Brassica cretica]
MKKEKDIILPIVVGEKAKVCSLASSPSKKPNLYLFCPFCNSRSHPSLFLSPLHPSNDFFFFYFYPPNSTSHLQRLISPNSIPRSKPYISDSRWLGSSLFSRPREFSVSAVEFVLVSALLSSDLSVSYLSYGVTLMS